jgi:methionyl-tRNA formyltransferase
MEQDESKATYCRKLDKEDCPIDWSKPAVQIHNQIRALSTAPGAYSFLRGQQLKLMETEVLEDRSDEPAGRIVSLTKNVGFTVQTGDYLLLVKYVQPAGKAIMTAWAYHLGARLQTGERLQSHE